MNKNSLWTIVGVILAVVIAWWIVSALFSILWFIAKLAIVLVVAAVVFLVLRGMFSSKAE
jgi:membrane protein YdbS with pleckstrin-like domain